MPAYGRVELARVCLRQLRRTCDALTDYGIFASAVVVADDANLETAAELDFATVRRDNQFLSQKFNDAVEVACSPAINPKPFSHVVMCGSDDWIDWRILTDLPAAGTVHGFPRLSFVREDGQQITPVQVGYTGGCGMRIYPASVMRALDYRPADEDRTRACDTSILTNLRVTHEQAGRPLRIFHVSTDPRSIVDWKSSGEQINAYDGITGIWRSGDPQPDPFAVLADVYPAEALEEMAAFYSVDRELVAA